ncbi:peptidoglycan-binding domain-containing protein [Streptomyces sp. NBC_00525]|uniref:peptidoglycan-binding domain-containing protein n=1 Tax=Streptomyces sp. NBC_00525 TaxID=2903660 RepID=UPI002E812AFD|nr:peptidoglycan-binding domain-containing protein [Streptomyces sp. NBC_00525]WUC95111.1 peptidoglycan-binding protein [Streptomyces sp. NBC_00525]
MPRNRRHVLFTVAALAVTLTGAGLASTAFISSPQQAAAEAGPPAPDVLTAPVERRVLTDTIVLRGQVTAGRTFDVSSAGPSGKDAGSPVVTKVMVKAGAAVKPGKVLLEISGRPLFSLEGKLPVYRDLRPGSRGDDVRQLQQALAAVGFGSQGDRAGYFGTATKTAVTRFYASLGYDPVPAQEDGQLKLREARRTATDMERAVQDAEPGTAKQRAREDLEIARDELNAVEAADGPMVPASELAFFPVFPARVDSLDARVGGPVGDKLLTVSAGDLVVKGSLGSSEVGLVRPGQKVRILSELTGTSASGVVESVADGLSAAGPDAGEEGAAPAADGEKGAVGHALVVTPTKALPAELAHQNVRLTVEAATSKAKVLVVPISAVSAGADARTTVTVLLADGGRRRIEVRPGISGDGYVEVTPVGGTGLAPGDKVIVGGAPAGGASAQRGGPSS